MMSPAVFVSLLFLACLLSKPPAATPHQNEFRELGICLH